MFRYIHRCTGAMASKTLWDIPLQCFDRPQRQSCFSSKSNIHIQLTEIFCNPTFSLFRFDDTKLKGSPSQFFMWAALGHHGKATVGFANFANGTKQARMDNYWGFVVSYAQLCTYAISMRPDQTLRAAINFLQLGRSTWPARPSTASFSGKAK